MIRTVKMKVDVPDGVLTAEIREYITNALKGWGGGGRLEDPFFHGLKVHRLQINRSYQRKQ